MADPETLMTVETTGSIALAYPVMLTPAFFKRAAVLVVGGGKVAARRVKVLLEAGARIRLIAPTVTPELAVLIETTEGQIEWLERPWQVGDVRNFPAALLVFAATDDPAVNAAVETETRQEGRLLNRADLPAACDFTLPGVVRSGDITVAVSAGIDESGEASPALTVHLRRKLAETIGPEYGRLAALLRELRPIIKKKIDRAARPALWKKIIESPALELLKEGREDEAQQLLANIMREESEKG